MDSNLPNGGAAVDDSHSGPGWEMNVALATHTLGNKLGGNGILGTKQAAAKSQRNLFAWASRRGFAGIEVGAWWYDFYREPLTDIKRLRDDIVGAGLQLVGFNCLRKCVTHPAVADENRRDLQRAVEVACEVGVPFVSISLSLDADVAGVPQADVRGTQISPGGSRDAHEEEFGVAGEFLRSLAQMAQPYDVEIALELHHCSLADTSQSLLRLLDIADMPNISANPDLGNITWGYAVPEESWQEAATRLAGRVKFWHVKNLHRIYFPEIQRAVFVHALLGEGDIDYRWAIATMLAGGFDGWLSLEAAGAGDWLGMVARGKAYLDDLGSDIAGGSGLEVYA